jgi:hypothetical protein
MLASGVGGDIFAAGAAGQLDLGWEVGDVLAGVFLFVHNGNALLSRHIPQMYHNSDVMIAPEVPGSGQQSPDTGVQLSALS